MNKKGTHLSLLWLERVAGLPRRRPVISGASRAREIDTTGSAREVSAQTCPEAVVVESAADVERARPRAPMRQQAAEPSQDVLPRLVGAA